MQKSAFLAGVEFRYLSVCFTLMRGNFIQQAVSNPRFQYNVTRYTPKNVSVVDTPNFCVVLSNAPQLIVRGFPSQIFFFFNKFTPLP